MINSIDYYFTYLSRDITNTFMADNSVYIAGVADGAFEKSLGDLPPWATEGTLNDIKNILKKSYDVQAKALAAALKKSIASGGLVPEDVKKVNDELSKLHRSIVRNNEDSTKAHKRAKTAEADDKKGILSSEALNAKGSKLGYIFAGLAAGGTKVLKVTGEYLDVYDSMFKSGINVLNGNNSTADGFEALNQLVNQTGLRLQTLQQVAEKYSSTMNVVGISKFGKALAMSTNRMQELGYSQEESAEFMGAMLEAEKGISNVRAKSAGQISTDTVKLAQQFTRLSLSVGISRQQLLENLKTAAKSAESTQVAAIYGEAAAKNTAAAMAGLDDFNRDMLLKMSASLQPITTEISSAMQRAGLGDLAVQLAQVAKEAHTVDMVGFQERLKSVVDAIPPGKIAGLAPMLLQGNADAAATNDAITKLQHQVRNYSRVSESQLNGAVKTEASIAKFQTQLERAAAIPQAAFFPMVKQVEGAAEALKLFNDAVYSSIGAVNAEARSWIGLGVIIAGFAASVLLGGTAIDRFLSIFGTSTTAASTAATGAAAASTTLAGRLLATAAAATKVTLGLAAAATGGWAVGTMIKDHLETSEGGREFLDDVGGTITEILANFGNKAAQETRDTVDRNRQRQAEEAAALKSRDKKLDSKSPNKVESNAAPEQRDNTKNQAPVVMDVPDEINKILSENKIATQALTTISQNENQSATVISKLSLILAEMGVASAALNIISQKENNIVTEVSKLISQKENQYTNDLSKINSILVNAWRPDASYFKLTAEQAASSTAANLLKSRGKIENTSISIPKTPMASTIISPSSTVVQTSEVPGDNSLPITSSPASITMAKPDHSADINSMLSFQSNLLEQILLSSTSLVSVNREILRYTRNSV